MADIMLDAPKVIASMQKPTFVDLVQEARDRGLVKRNRTPLRQMLANLHNVRLSEMGGLSDNHPLEGIMKTYYQLGIDLGILATYESNGRRYVRSTPLGRMAYLTLGMEGYVFVPPIDIPKWAREFID